MIQAMFPECERYGIDQAEVERRLAFFGLGDDADEAVDRAHRALQPHLDGVIEEFYAHLQLHAALKPLLQDVERIGRLKVTQRRYLETLGIGRRELRYFEDRLRIGRAHERVGLSPTYYLGAYATLAGVLAKHLAASSAGGAEVGDILSTLHRLMLLDADLAITTYHGHKHDELVQSVRRDALTGLDSRGFLLSRLTDECVRAERFGNPLAVVFLDLDGFKKVNDTAGHEVGDSILMEVANCIRRSIRPSDIAGRYGGDEFLVGIIEGDEEAALLVAERIRERVASSFAATPGATTASLGIALRHRGDDPVSLIRRADAAMYQAKRGGRNRVVVDR